MPSFQAPVWGLKGPDRITADVPGVSFYTLGCKLNQLETESIAAAFGKAGFKVVPWDLPRNSGAENREKVSVFVINTCTVTSKAEQKARRVIRLALRESSAPVIVTGCYARLEAEKLAVLEAEYETEIYPRLFIVPAKDSLLDLPFFLAEQAGSACGFRMAEGIQNWLQSRPGKTCTAKTCSDTVFRRIVETPSGNVPGGMPDKVADGTFRFNPDVFSFHSRAFLKIQDGCNRRCAYCRVPLARGASRSLDSAELLARIRALEAKNQAEAVLTGVNIAQYRCPGTGKNLGELLCFLLDNTVSIALRLSSIEAEPGFFNPAFLKALSHNRLRPHFHLSVQSGSASVLAAMGRPYGPADIRESAALLRSVKADPFLACDIITGFPGESEADFEKTCELCAGIGFAWIHGFPYSPRPGTSAYGLKNRAGERESARRLGRLLELARSGREAYVRRWTGRTVDAVVEAKKLPFSGVLTDNYLRIRVDGVFRATGEPESGGLVPGLALRCRITQLLQPGSGLFDAMGEIVVPAFSFEV
jgi:threonylcarbamoyladenosine tRNA methylthiotransferase MtaB